MKTLVACLLCFVLGTAVGSIWTKRADRDAVGEQSGNQSTLRSAVPGIADQSYLDVDPGNSAVKTVVRPVFDFDSLHLLNPIDLYRAIEHLDAGALADLARDVQELPSHVGRTGSLQKEILVRLAQIDPDAALSFSETPEDEDWFRGVFMEIAKQDLSRAVAMLKGAQDRRMFETLANALVGSGAPGAGQAVANLLQERGDVSLDKYSIEAVALSFGNDLDGGIAFMESLLAGQKSAALIPLLANVATTDPQRALSLLEAHGQDRDVRARGISSIAETWLKADPAAARAWVGSLENFHERAAALESTVWAKNEASRQWGAEQIAWLASDADFSSQLGKRLATSWANDDPQAALEWVRDLPHGAIRRSAEESYWPEGMWGKLVAEGSEAVTAVYESLQEGDPFRRSLGRSMITGWGAVDPEAAADYANAGREDPMLASGLSFLLESWAQRDFESARAWAGKVDGPSGDWAASSVIRGVAQRDHLAAAAELDRVSAGLDGEEFGVFNGAAKVIAESWSKADPEAAVEWSIGLPETDRRLGIVDGVFEGWLKDEPEEASAWLVDAEPGRDRDRAINTLIESIVGKDPQNAFRWAENISGEQERESGFWTVINSWRFRDKAAARAALESADVSEDFRKRLLGQFPAE